MTGAARFFLVRGDSAQIPADLLSRGALPDSTRWYLERHEDETAQTGSVLTAARSPRLAAQPVKSTSWGAVKALYLP